jgi:glycosyltransferase involved in cell wall biosynthesis
VVLKIDLFCNDGSPLNIIPPDIYGRGVGGAELAMMSWAKTMASRGHLIRIYNNPSIAGVFDGVEYLPQRAFVPSEPRDVFIVYRSPNPHVQTAKADIKIHWSCDQYTIGHFGRDIFPFVDKVVCISPFHVEYHKQTYGVDNGKIGYFDLGVRLQDYEQEIDKIPGRCIFCSIPDRGLELLRRVWPDIKAQIPEASLVITSDYRLWGSHNPGNHQHRMDWLQQPDVVFLGKIPREQLVKEQLAAECMSYPSIYQELHCISASECQVAGATPVTSSLGALPTTNQWGYVLDGNPADGNWLKHFTDIVIAQLNKPDDPYRQQMKHSACQRFNWQRICGQWEKLIETGEFDNSV